MRVTLKRVVGYFDEGGGVQRSNLCVSLKKYFIFYDYDVCAYVYIETGSGFLIEGNRIMTNAHGMV